MGTLGNDGGIIVLIVLLVLGLLTAITLISKKMARTKAETKVRASYGRPSKRTYTSEELEKIKGYYLKTHKEGEYSVDDITWNDLSMDDIFINMNHTFSSPGEETLYKLLREPAMETSKLVERENLIRFFDTHSNTRQSMQADFLEMGRTKKYSLVQYLENFKNIKRIPNWIHLVYPAILTGGIVLAFFEPIWGIMIIICSVVANIVAYYKKKELVEPYYISIAAVSYLTKCAKKLTSYKDAELEPYVKELKDYLKPLSGFSRDAAVLGTGNVVGGSSDLGQMLLDYLRMITHFDFLFFNHLVKLVGKNEESIYHLFETAGFLEAMIAISSYRQTIPFYCNMEASEEKKLNLVDGYHPLLAEPVANCIETDRPVLITGSNASGKSTFIKMTALSAILAQSVNTVHAHHYSAPFFRIYTSMALTDSIENGESYYMVEIRSIKRIMDALEGETPVLCFVDEVLRGTNTVERIAASSQILKKLAEAGAMSFAATHDIELTQILEKYYQNYHFTENIIDDEISFSYIIQKGRATSRNAIKLLEVMGYEAEVVNDAQAAAEDFVREGVWKNV